MAAYSKEEYNKYEEWLFKESGQIRFFNNHNVLSNTDKHRCIIINDFKSLCEKHRLSISLDSYKRF